MFNVYANQPTDQQLKEGEWVPVFANMNNQGHTLLPQSGQIGWIQVHPNQNVGHQTPWQHQQLPQGHQQWFNFPTQQQIPNQQQLYQFQNSEGQFRNVQTQVQQPQQPQQQRIALLPTPVMPSLTTNMAMGTTGNIINNNFNHSNTKGTLAVHGPLNVIKTNNALNTNNKHALIAKRRHNEKLSNTNNNASTLTENDANISSPPNKRSRMTKTGQTSSDQGRTTKYKWSALKHFNTTHTTQNTPNTNNNIDQNINNNTKNTNTTRKQPHKKQEHINEDKWQKHTKLSDMIFKIIQIEIHINFWQSDKKCAIHEDLNQIFTNINPPCGDEDYKTENIKSETNVKKIIKNLLLRHLFKQHNSMVDSLKTYLPLAKTEELILDRAFEVITKIKKINKWDNDFYYNTYSILKNFCLHNTKNNLLEDYLIPDELIVTKKQTTELITNTTQTEKLSEHCNTDTNTCNTNMDKTTTNAFTNTTQTRTQNNTHTDINDLHIDAPIIDFAMEQLHLSTTTTNNQTRPNLIPSPTRWGDMDEEEDDIIFHNTQLHTITNTTIHSSATKQTSDRQLQLQPTSKSQQQLNDTALLLLEAVSDLGNNKIKSHSLLRRYILFILQLGLTDLNITPPPQILYNINNQLLKKLMEADKIQNNLSNDDLSIAADIITNKLLTKQFICTRIPLRRPKIREAFAVAFGRDPWWRRIEEVFLEEESEQTGNP